MQENSSILNVSTELLHPILMRNEAYFLHIFIHQLVYTD